MDTSFSNVILLLHNIISFLHGTTLTVSLATEQGTKYLLENKTGKILQQK